jgi:hypothetical protein
MLNADFAARAAALAERACGPEPISWRPDMPELRHPNPIVGLLERVVDGPDRGWGPTRIAELRDPDGQAWSVWLLGHVLKTEFDQERVGSPRPGELVAVRYEGRKQRRDARPGENGGYESYRVVVDRDPRAPQPQQVSTGTHLDEPEPAVAGRDVPVCAACGYRDGAHAEGCPEDYGDVPF